MREQADIVELWTRHYMTCIFSMIVLQPNIYRLLNAGYLVWANVWGPDIGCIDSDWSKTWFTSTISRDLQDRRTSAPFQTKNISISIQKLSCDLSSQFWKWFTGTGLMRNWMQMQSWVRRFSQRFWWNSMRLDWNFTDFHRKRQALLQLNVR